VSIATPRRYYLLKRLAASEQGDDELAAVWRAKQESISWPALPADFPARETLVAEGYTTVRDLDGADADELTNLGLTDAQVSAVLAAMENWTMISATLNSYQRQDGRFATTYNAPLLPSAARTASGTGDTYEMGDMSTLRLKLDVTAASGSSPTLDVTIETSPDGASDWQTVATFAQKTAISYERNAFPGCDRFVRVKYTIGGSTPSFTFSVTGEAL